MLISHRYKFIFIKTVKTAGTSIEVELSKHMDDDDIVTPVGPPEPGHRPRNYILNGIELRPHGTAAQIRRAAGAEIFENYTKFCVEREPVDKCISHYSMLKNSPDHNTTGRELSWRRYISKGNFPADHRSYLSSTGRLLVDHILRYEELEKEMSEFMATVGLSISQIRVRAKSGFREPGLRAGFKSS